MAADLSITNREQNKYKDNSRDVFLSTEVTRFDGPIEAVRVNLAKQDFKADYGLAQAFSVSIPHVTNDAIYKLSVLSGVDLGVALEKTKVINQGKDQQEIAKNLRTLDEIGLKYGFRRGELLQLITQVDSIQKIRGLPINKLASTVSVYAGVMRFNHFASGLHDAISVKVEEAKKREADERIARQREKEANDRQVAARQRDDAVREAARVSAANQAKQAANDAYALEQKISANNETIRIASTYSAGQNSYTVTNLELSNPSHARATYSIISTSFPSRVNITVAQRDYGQRLKDFWETVGRYDEAKDGVQAA